MKISFLSVSLFVCIINISHAQQEGSYSEDFNLDGVTDALYIWYDGGSGFGGYYGQVTNGATGKIYELNTWGCFCDIKLVVPFPPEASLPEHKPFYEALTDKLFPDIESKSDPTLDWIIQANLLAIVPENDDFYDLILPVRPSWNNGAIAKTSKYQLKIDDLMIKSAYHPIEELPSWIEDSKEGYLVYYGNNHDLHLERIEGDETESFLWKGKHSLILRKGDRESVLFITDNPLTSGPGRLRDPSISGVVSNGEFAIFTVSESPEPSFRIYVADLNSGMVARLKESLVGYGGKIFVEENNLYDQEGQIVVEDLSKIISNLIERSL
jgi:hypothetical protein